MFKKMLQKHFRTDGEPRKIGLLSTLSMPLRFAVLIILISVGTNAMPFYSDGTRMNLVDGLSSVLMEEQGSFTKPFARPDGGEALTQKAAPAPGDEFFLDDEAGWGVPAKVGGWLRVDNTTAFILVILLAMMLINMISGFMDMPFAFTERSLNTMAFNPKISNSVLKASFLPVTAPAIIINVLISLVMGVLLLNVMVSDFEGQGIEILGIVLHPYSLYMVLFFALFWGKDIFSSHRFLNNLLSRRCSQCFHMDTTVIIDKQYVRTDVTTTTTYREKTDSLGHKSRTQTGQSTSSHDVYDYTYQCQNCGYTFKSRY